ncbi:MAG: choline dehydrogenase [Candidatus Limnocylindria bacterium]
MAAGRFDTIIVGGGSAGSVLANRLSEDPGHRVLVLEAGRSDWRIDPFIHMPAALTFPIGSRFYDWKYESEPEPFMHGRRIYHARGKVLGGSSSINGQIFQRGNPLDYERWAADPGMASWDYAHCLPYFKRMETCLAAAPDDPWRGHSGPLVLERGPATNPLFGAFFDATVQAGYPRTEDVNGYRQEGFAPFDRNIHRGRRLSAARAYLHPIMRRRPNLTVRTSTMVTGIRFDGRRAVGVDVRRWGRAETIRAGEVILAGGAINTPQLLLLAGIGPAAELASLGIPVMADVPGVGRHLQDHLEVYIQYRSLRPVSMQPSATELWRRPFIGAQWLFLRSGPGATNHFEGGGFVRSNDEVAYPNLMFHFLPLSIRYDGSAGTKGHGYQVHVGPMYSDARGTITLRSTDPFEHPALRFNYLSTDQDRREWIEAVRVARHILNQPAMGPFNGGETSPGGGVETDDEILDWVRRDAETALHPSCTARMGVDDESVLDPLTMRVRGVDGLRVVDASAMPYVTNGNIYAPVMMLAEKAADLIRGDTPLAPEPIPFYRHGVSPAPE